MDSEIAEGDLAEWKRQREELLATPRLITPEKATRLVRVILSLQLCEDCTPELKTALTAARAAIAPWYDTTQR